MIMSVRMVVVVVHIVELQASEFEKEYAIGT